jgi:hypothetical protein
MHERSKLAEARHFLDRMYQEHSDPVAFARELSAFMAAGRSVLQYALKEAKSKSGGQKWYDQEMANPLFIFFKDLRDASIHDTPVTPLIKMEDTRAPMLNIGDDEEEMWIPHEHNTTTHHYEFQGRSGEEVLDVSREYLTALEKLVEGGGRAGFITG